MALKFPGAWRFARKPDTIPRSVRHSFDDLIGKIAFQADRWTILEHFKGNFIRSIGGTHVRSSSEDWAESDLRSYMEHSAENAPLFIDAFYEGCEDLRKAGLDVPGVDLVNDILAENGVPYRIQPPDLVKVDSGGVVVPAPPPPPTLAENASSLLQESSRRAEQLLSDSRPREAVQEMLWMLESLVTVFRGTGSAGSEVRGKYFNEIAKQLRAESAGTTLERVIDWCIQLHGYLSSPTGGGVRHGLDLQSGTPISVSEGRLFCNLVLSYVGFLLSEHEKRVAGGG